MTAPVPPAQPDPSVGASRFGAPPWLSIAGLVLVSLGGAAAYVWASTRDVVAMCGSQRMGPGDLCDTVTRSGMVTGTETYTEILAQAQRTNQVIGWVGLGLVVVGIALAVLTVIRWRQDVDLKSQLRDDHGPANSAHSSTASSNIGVVIFGAGFVGLATYLLLQGLSKDEWPWFIGTAVAGLLGLGMLWGSIPANGKLVQTFRDGIRVVSNRKVVDLPWRDVDYRIVPAKGTAHHHISGPGLKGLPLASVSGSPALQQIVQQQTIEARYPAALEAIDRGESVPFGEFAVSRDGISNGRKTLPWSEYGGVSLSQGNVTIAKSPKGRFASTTLGKVPNYALFVNVVDEVVKRQPRTAPAL